MSNLENEDISVAWGQPSNALDAQFGRWRLAVFQDVQEAIDSSKLYFLYDPDCDERSLTTGARKGGASIVIFDLNIRCFAGEMPLQVYGTVKFLFALKAPAQSGGTSFVLVTETQNDYGKQLHFSRLDLWADGRSIAGNQMLLRTPLEVADDFICTMREDVPELVVIASPGMQVWRIDAMASQPGEPSAYFTVPGAELSHFYDGFVCGGSVHLLSAFADGNLDYSRIHVLSLNNPGQITTHTCHADVSRGMPPARKEAAIETAGGCIIVAGGEIDYGGNVQRLTDYWTLDLNSFQWKQIPASMPIPLIEPRLTTTYSGNIYLWGDFDQPLPGMPHGTHLRILRIRGLGGKDKPPSYEQSVYPNVTGGGGAGIGGGAAPYSQSNIGGGASFPAAPAAPYPQVSVPYPPTNPDQAPPYPSFAPNPNQGYSQPGGMIPQPGYGSGPGAPGYPTQGGYPQDGGNQGGAGPSYPQGGQGYPQGGQGYPEGTHAVYPPKQKKKSCSIM